MEKKTLIPQYEFLQGFFIEIECCMCGNKQTIAEISKKELHALVKKEGWRNLNSDDYGLTGWYDGCDYKD